MEKTSQAQINEPTTSVIRKIGRGLKAYLTDWKNLLGHALLGVGLVVVAVWAPINPWIKAGIVACLIAFNIFRMTRKNKKTKA